MSAGTNETVQQTIIESRQESAPVTVATGKIKELEQLSQILAAHQADGAKVVLCHGVFDLLHIGHIRHFEEAKKNGEILVVTLTPDRHVNKGPHRPAFSQILRAEAIAALNIVDYVAINNGPMAIDLIRLLRPNFYVKGSDYIDADKDVTGGIILEREAVEFVGGQLVFTNDIVFSSSALINRHLPVLSKELSDYLESFSRRYSADDVASYFEKMKALKVLTIGETIIDEYQYCQAIGKSSKEPMLAVKELSSEKFAGGILAVANHVANFSDQVGLLSLLGDINSEEDFVRQSLKEKIDAQLLIRRNAPTIVKKRFIESYFFTKLLEIYSINDTVLDAADNQLLCRKLEELIPDYDAVIVVDFGHSMITPEAAKIICDKARFLAINTQSNAGNLGYQSIYKYSRANYVCVTENKARLELRDRSSDARAIIPKLAGDLSADKIIVTQGKRGCTCFSTQEGFYQLPAVAGQVVDRLGAGDAFLSVTSLAAALNAPLEMIGFIGNAVGAQAVATVGHRGINLPGDAIEIYYFFAQMTGAVPFMYKSASTNLTATLAPALPAAGSLDFADYFDKLHQLLGEVQITGSANQQFSADTGIAEAMAIILQAKAAKRKVIVIGNGGSAAIASHQALDLWNAAGIPALTFNDAAQLTCLSNDYGYENVFSKAIEIFAQSGDVLIAISSSGRSKNILNAVEAAKEKGCAVISYSGFSQDAPLRSAGNLNFFVDSNQYGLVEVAHQALLHYLTDKLADTTPGVT